MTVTPPQHVTSRHVVGSYCSVDRHPARYSNFGTGEDRGARCWMLGASRCRCRHSPSRMGSTAAAPCPLAVSACRVVRASASVVRSGKGANQVHEAGSHRLFQPKSSGHARAAPESANQKRTDRALACRTRWAKYLDLSGLLLARMLARAQIAARRRVRKSSLVRSATRAWHQMNHSSQTRPPGAPLVPCCPNPAVHPPRSSEGLKQPTSEGLEPFK